MIEAVHSGVSHLFAQSMRIFPEVYATMVSSEHQTMSPLDMHKWYETCLFGNMATQLENLEPRSFLNYLIMFPEPRYFCQLCLLWEEFGFALGLTH